MRKREGKERASSRMGHVEAIDHIESGEEEEWVIGDVAEEVDLEAHCE